MPVGNIYDPFVQVWITVKVTFGRPEMLHYINGGHRSVTKEAAISKIRLESKESSI